MGLQQRQPKTMPTGALNVLFLSGRNAAESVIAEAILRVEGNGRLRSHSAGVEPAASLNAEVVRFLEMRQLPVEGLRPKPLAELEAQHTFDFVITLSPRAEAFAEQHAWRGDPVIGHWRVDSEPQEMRDAFWTLSRRIRILASLAHRKATRRSIANRLNALQAL